MRHPFDTYKALTSRCVEPERRMVGGQFGRAVHRFPIKGGIPFIDAMLEDIAPTSTPLLQQFLKKR